ncbi:hypothetical protein fh0823_23350 [Francisella halioticida]|nr:hypothetical protein fh0823_23350 [Francisella halioticida]
MLKKNVYSFGALDDIIVVKFAPKGYSVQTFNSFKAVMYIILHDKTKSIAAVIKPHAATTKGNDNIPAPIVVPTIRKTEPINLEFIS